MYEYNTEDFSEEQEEESRIPGVGLYFISHSEKNISKTCMLPLFGKQLDNNTYVIPSFV